MRVEIKKGLDVPLPGRPEQAIEGRIPVASAGLIPQEYRGVVPTLLVGAGERVTLGQPVLRDEARPSLVLTAPGTGVVRLLGGSPRHPCDALVVDLDDATEDTCAVARPRNGREGAIQALLDTGLWTSFRERPFGSVATPARRPRAIFVTAMDSDPLAARPEVVLADAAEDFARGVDTLTQLTDGHVHLCKREGADVPAVSGTRIEVHEFTGPHPAGLPGTHIHFIDPAGRGRFVWHVGYPDVVAIGRLFRAAQLTVERVVALAGPMVARPRLVRTRVGADIGELTRGELLPGACRVVSGSVLSGRQATRWGRYLGRYHLQVCALAEAGRARAESAGERTPTTALHGRRAPMFPTGAFERVLPLHLLATPLLEALLVGDLDTAEALGALELDEEDLALCTYACPSKLEYGTYLRAALERMREVG